MQLINIFNTGGLTTGLTLFWAVISGIMLYQTFKAHNSGWTQQAPDGIKEGKEKVKFTSIPQFWIFIALTAFYILALLFVASDYKGV